VEIRSAGVLRGRSALKVCYDRGLQSAMERTERLLDLIALLLDAKQPVSFAALRKTFPDDYGGSPEASERKFERDKAELLELGIPLTFSQETDEQPAGYAVDRARYYLPPLDLKPEELAVLYAAGSAALGSGAFPGASDLAFALRKLSFFADGLPPVPKVRLEVGAAAHSRELPQRLEALWAALSARKSVDLEYYSPHRREVTVRRVDPWGLALRRGTWTLVGHCHLRAAQRTFQVHRIRSLTVNASKPKSPDYEIPADFSLDAAVAAWPWQHQLHPPLEVTVALTGALAPLTGQLFPGEGVATPQGREVTLQVTHLDGLRSYVLSLGAEARITAPEQARAGTVGALEQVLAAHGGAA
jgi:proteasome accessory factor B